MTFLEIDPIYVAKQLKLARQYLGLTQENVADASGLTTRTIEKVESGRHTPSEQTLRSLSRGLKLDIVVFSKPTPAEEALTKAEMMRSMKKIAIVQTTAIKTANDFLLVRDGCEVFRFDTTTVEGDEAQDIAATLVDSVTDIMDVWPDLSSTDRLYYAREVAGMCLSLSRLGYTCLGGFHRERLPGKQPLTFRVGLLCVLKALPKEETRYAIVNLQGAWEIPEEDRPAVTSS